MPVRVTVILCNAQCGGRGQHPVRPRAHGTPVTAPTGELQSNTVMPSFFFIAVNQLTQASSSSELSEVAVTSGRNFKIRLDGHQKCVHAHVIPGHLC